MSLEHIGPLDAFAVSLHRCPGVPDGEWWVVKGRPAGMWTALGHVTLVATGNLEWNGNRAAEIYVPEDRLTEWRAEHDLP